MAGLECEELRVARPEHREVVVRDDDVVGDAVDERRVRKLERDAVAGPELVDVRERGQKGCSVSGDVHQAGLFTRHERLKVAAGAFFEGRLVGAVQKHHVQSEPRDDDLPERLSFLGVPPILSCE